MDSQLKELLQFLHDKNPQVRQVALSNLLGHTPKGSPARNIFFGGSRCSASQKGIDIECIRDLKVLCRDQITIAHDAFRALINLSDEPLLSGSLSDSTFMKFLVSYIIHPPSVLADLASMLLSNITSQPSACASLISLEIPVIRTESGNYPFYPTQSRSGTSPAPDPYPSSEERNVSALSLLLHAFVQAASTGRPEIQRSRKGDLHFLATVFANISMAATGRSFFLTPRPVDPLASMDSPAAEFAYPLSAIVIFSEHPDTIRRGGIASTIKHCAFHTAAHKAILLPESELVAVPPSSTAAPAINALPYILLPLAGPEDLDLEEQEKLPAELQLLPDTKKRESDEILRLTHVETLLLLCATRAGREYLREHGVYEIVRALHLVETVDKISEHVERLVMLLKGDETPLQEFKGDGWSLEVSDVDGNQKETQNSTSYLESTSSATATVEDDDDEQIVEV